MPGKNTIKMEAIQLLPCGVEEITFENIAASVAIGACLLLRINLAIEGFQSM